MTSSDTGSVGTTEDLGDLYDNAPCGYVSVTPDGRVAKVNQTLASWLGRPTEELTGRPVHDLLGFGGRIAYETHVAPTLRLQGKVEEIALDLLTADGRKLPVMANAAERRGADGQHLFTRLTVLKAGDRRRFERGLIAARDEAEARSRIEQEQSELRDQFIAVLGHDLRNPLAALGAGVRMLGRLGPAEPRAALILAQMEDSLRRANGLIDDVLDFARGQLGGGLPLACRTEADMNAVLTRIADEAEAAWPDGDLVRQLDVGAPVDCDPDRIGQLVSNLLSNARHHGAQDGPVTLSAWTTGGAFAVSVSNRGEPISEATRERLFRPFVRGGADQDRAGLGLGLFIVQEIAEAHDGRVEVRSSAEETCFTLTMPRVRTAAG